MKELYKSLMRYIYGSRSKVYAGKYISVKGEEVKITLIVVDASGLG